MQNGFYFKDNLVKADYFLLQKMKLIRTEADFNTVLVLNHKQHSFCSLFDYSENAEFILIFNDLTENDYTLISGCLDQKKKSSNPQKLLFIGHILFDYQKVLQKLIATLDPALILVLVDNNKSPFLITDKDIKHLSPILLNVINYQNQGVVSHKIKSKFNIKSLLKVILFQFLKLFLKPVQSFKDLYSTYNFNFFYGKLRILSVKTYFRIRHISVMSAIKFFYGLKVIIIRSFYAVLGFLQNLGVLTYFRIRHISVMSAIRFFYGLKVMIIRSFYFVAGFIQNLFVKLFYFLRHSFAMFFIYSKSIVNYTKGYLEWCYYRLEWCYFKIHEFNMNYTFYPVRKFFWFMNFQYKKRILKKI